MKSILIFFALIAVSLSLFAQNKKALKYYVLTNKAELAICDSNLEIANKYYVSAFKINKENPFSLDLINAYKVATDLKDWINAEIYFKKLISRGIKKSELDYYLKGENVEMVTNWCLKYSNDTLKYEHPIRKISAELSKTDQDVRKYSFSLHKDGNYMTDTVYKVDSINAQVLFDMFKMYGNKLPNEDLIGTFTGSPPYHILLLHQLQNNKSDLFDTMLYKAIFDYSILPNVYTPLVQNKFNKMHSFCFKVNCIQFPLSISVGKFEDSLFPEYFAPEIEVKINHERAKIGLCNLSDLRKKVAFNYAHQQNKSFLSKYGFLTGINGYLQAVSLEQILEWDKKNEPYKPKR